MISGIQKDTSAKMYLPFKNRIECTIWTIRTFRILHPTPWSWAKLSEVDDCIRCVTYDILSRKSAIMYIHSFTLICCTFQRFHYCEHRRHTDVYFCRIRYIFISWIHGWKARRRCERCCSRWYEVILSYLWYMAGKQGVVVKDVAEDGMNSEINKNRRCTMG